MNGNRRNRAGGARCGALSSLLFATLSGACWGGPAQSEQVGEPSLDQIEQAVRDGCAPASFAGKIARAGTDEVDLLFVVDDSGSMREELESVSRELPKVAQALTSGDLDGDGTADILPVQSLRIGVVTSNLGADFLEHLVPSCGVPGDNGAMLRSADGQRYFEFHAGDPLSAFEALTATVAASGTDGCGLEQPFEAALAALTGEPAYGRSHDGPDNGDFLRERSVLGVLLISDEDDCSALPPQRLFEDTEGLNMVCALKAEDPGVMTTVDSFVVRLRALRDNLPSRLVFGAFAGVPAGTSLSAAEILKDPRMQIVPDETSEHPTADLPRPVCTSDHGSASPARRITQAVGAFGDQGIVQSICDADLAQRMQTTVHMRPKSFAPRPAGAASD
jgi:hypothetical protein